MNTLVAVADAVVASLNAGTFSQQFTAERKYVPAFELAEMQTLHVTVVPKSVSIRGNTWRYFPGRSSRGHSPTSPSA